MARLKPQDRAAELCRRWLGEGCEIGRPREIELSVAIDVAQEATREATLAEMAAEVTRGLFSADEMAAFGVEDADDATLVAADLNELAAERFLQLSRAFHEPREDPDEPELAPDQPEDSHPLQTQLAKLLQESRFIGDDDPKFD